MQPAQHPRDFARVLAAEGISNFGSMLSRLAIPWVAALTLQATPLQMAALLVADVVAAALGSLLLGNLVDRTGKRRIMLWADALRCLLLALLALAVWQGWGNWAMLVAAAALSGLLTVAFELARSAWVALSVAAVQLPRRNAHLSVAGSVSEAIAFAVGGWLYQWLGAALALAVDALSYAASALALRGVQDVAPAARGNRAGSRWRALGEDTLAGLRAIVSHPSLRALAGIEALIAFSGSLTGTSIMIFVVRDLTLPTGLLGMIFATGALGAIVGAFLAPGLGRRVGPGRAMTFGLVAFALGAVCVPLAAVGGSVAVALLIAHQVVGDGGHTLHDVHDRSLRQTAVTPALMARVDAGIRSVGYFATLAGAGVGGLLGNAHGARSVLVLAAASSALATLLAAWTLGRRAAHLAAAP